MMKPPFYIGLDEARQALAEIGINLTPKQIKRAADPDAAGRRKLPFFVDPIDGRLKIERGTLLEMRQPRLDQRLTVRARRQHIGCHAQGERPEIARADNMRDGLMRHATLNQCGKAFRFVHVAQPEQHILAAKLERMRHKQFRIEPRRIAHYRKTRRRITQGLGGTLHHWITASPRA